MALKLDLAHNLETVIGFTGTQHGLTTAQKNFLLAWLSDTYVRRKSFFHHGDCVGADEQAARIARYMGYKLVCHPPTDLKKRAFVTSDITLAPKPYLKRNLDIAVAAHTLLVCPKEYTEQLRSGTWSTYRYAQKLGRQFVIVYPDGSSSNLPPSHDSQVEEKRQVVPLKKRP